MTKKHKHETRQGMCTFLFKENYDKESDAITSI